MNKSDLKRAAALKSQLDAFNDYVSSNSQIQSCLLCKNCLLESAAGLQCARETCAVKNLTPICPTCKCRIGLTNI